MMFNRFTRQLIPFMGAFALAVMLPFAAHAHVSAGETVGFWHGLQHPIEGLDHILAMLAVGLWATQIGGRALWAVPLTFVSVMAIGGVLGIVGAPIPFVEQGIIASDLILGGLVLLATRLPLSISMVIVGLLAIFHGYAHGQEMPKEASGLLYATGFVLSTALLHLSGMGIALIIKNLLKEKMVRIAGGGILLGGIYVLVQSLT
jgi:urease accessory protein